MVPYHPEHCHVQFPKAQQTRQPFTKPDTMLHVLILGNYSTTKSSDRSLLVARACSSVYCHAEYTMGWPSLPHIPNLSQVPSSWHHHILTLNPAMSSVMCMSSIVHCRSSCISCPRVKTQDAEASWNGLAQAHYQHSGGAQTG